MKRFIITLLATCSPILANTAITLSDELPAIQSADTTQLCVDIEGLTVVTHSGLKYSMLVGSREEGSNVFAAEYTIGSTTYEGTFSVEENYPILSEEGDCLTLRGLVDIQFSDSSSNSALYAWLGINASAQTVEMDQVTFSFDIRKESSITIITRSVSGRFTIDGKIYELDETPMDAPAEISGYAPIFEKLVPEPSTATLSLLALAGLCMRRRRN